MIYNSPFYGFPRKYNRYQSYYYPQTSNHNYPQSVRNISGSFPQNPQISSSKKSQSNLQNTEISSKIDNEEEQNRSSDNAIFELFGIKLHFDDILLICLIFFLYDEGVQDQYLFIALILLLLS